MKGTSSYRLRLLSHPFRLVLVAGLLVALGCFAAAPDNTSSVAGAPAGAPPTPQYNIRVQAIRVADDNGGRPAPITAANMQAMIAGMNTIYLDAGIQFTFDPIYDWATLNSTAINNVTCEGVEPPATVEAQKKETARYPGKIVYFFRYGPGADPINNGCTSNPWDQDFVNSISLGRFEAPGSWLGMAHETGHYLGLDHTFTALGNKDEIANYLATRPNEGKNALDGDGLDTPPDPGTGVWDSGWDCNGTNSVEIGGYTFTPSVRNVMSYYFCENERFSPKQIELMRSSLQHPLRKNLVQPPCPPDFIGVPMGQFQTCINYWNKRGLWPVTLTQYTAGGATYLGGSFQQGDNRPVYMNMPRHEFEKKVADFKANGWRPDQVSVLNTSGGPLFTAVWKKAEGAFHTVNGMEDYHYQGELTDLRAKGYVHQDVWIYKEKGKLKYGSTFVQRPSTDWLTRSSLTSAKYTELWNSFYSQGFRTTRFQPYVDNGQRRYVAIMEKLPGAWAHYRDMTPAQVVERYNELSAQGLRIYHMNALDNNFSIIFMKP